MVEYFRNLPHYQPKGEVFFITFRLAGSIPVEILFELRKNYEEERKILLNNIYSEKILRKKLYELQKKYFGKYDAILDSNAYGPDYLINEEVASIVYNKIIGFDMIKYDLIVFTIEPNHVHMVIIMYEDIKVSDNNKKGKTKDYVLADTLRLLKGSTSREANIVLNRKGQFWHHESYDHVVRDEAELKRIISYVLNNPVRSGSVKNPLDWRWSYSIYGV